MVWTVGQNNPPVYNDDLDAYVQVTAEEDIASIILDYQETVERFDGDYPPLDWPREEECADLGRSILKYVLYHFRPDLFIDEDENMAWLNS